MIVSTRVRIARLAAIYATTLAALARSRGGVIPTAGRGPAPQGVGRPPKPLPKPR